MNLKVKTKLHKINVIQSFIYSFFFYFSSPYRMNCIQHLSWKKKKMQDSEKENTSQASHPPQIKYIFNIII